MSTEQLVEEEKLLKGKLSRLVKRINSIRSMIEEDGDDDEEKTKKILENIYSTPPKKIRVSEPSIELLDTLE